MEEKILSFLKEHPGSRKRYVASHLHIWHCNSDFLKCMSKLQKENKIYAITHNDPAQLEWYDEWFAV